MSFIIASDNIKYLETTMTKDVQYLSNKMFGKTLQREIKKA